MGWLSFITGLIKLADIAAKYAHDRQLISAGVAEAVAAGNSATLANIEKARRAKDAVTTGSDVEFSKRVRDRFSTDE